jgi:hypothetical protein
LPAWRPISAASSASVGGVAGQFVDLAGVGGRVGQHGGGGLGVIGPGGQRQPAFARAAQQGAVRHRGGKPAL